MECFDTNSIAVLLNETNKMTCEAGAENNVAKFNLKNSPEIEHREAT